MHRVVTFESERFDLAAEDPHPINPPIHGQSVARWLSSLLAAAGIEVTEIDVEDWGWYLEARFEERWYLVGFVAHPPQAAGERTELIIQVDKLRSLKEKLLGRSKIDELDPLVERIVGWVRALDDVETVEVLWSG